jgi:Capsule assembly protein Wzi
VTVRAARIKFAACMMLALSCGMIASAASSDDIWHSESFMASSAVPLDSWVYPAFDRLIALGYALSGMQGMRPWTRLECARLIEEARQSLNAQGDAANPEAKRIVDRLALEFVYETALLRGESPNRSAGVTEAYFRATQISGPPLRDAFHFAQTIDDDFGRPYGQGFNSIAGIQVHAEYGPFAVVLRGESQQARSLFAYNPAALEAIASMDDLPVQPLPGISALARVRPVEATVSMNLLGWQATFGEQSQWWGQLRSTSLILSNNAEAPVVLLIQHDKPVQFPGVFAYLGKINNTFFLGQLRGQHYVRGPVPALTLFGSATKTLNPQPFLWGDQLDLKISPNFELGFEITCMWAGYGRPATVGTWLHTFSFHGNAQPVDPGKRYGGFQFAYKLPGLRQVSLYTDALSNDEPTPVLYATRSAISPGIYIARLPHWDRVDLRAEAAYTNIPHYADGVGAIYFNQHYASGYRNAGQLMGSWVGRAGTAFDAQTNYWISAVSRVDFSVRRQFNDRHMIGGGDLTDFSAHTFLELHGPLQLEGSLTAERWRFPILQSSPANNFTATFGVVLSSPAKRAP